MTDQRASSDDQCTYSKEAEAQLFAELAMIAPQRHHTVESILMRSYKCAQATEHARHGFARRIGTLARCVENAFALIPPNFSRLPDFDRLADATIQIQAFAFNLVGALDNLAWLWVLETRFVQDNGKPWPKQRIGLRKSNSAIRGSFPAEIRSRLSAFDDWFDYVEEFRDALAHRIPLYIPPSRISNADANRYSQLEQESWDALKRGDREAHVAARSAQDGLTTFIPLIVQQTELGPKLICFHPQLLTDFKTLIGIAEMVLLALDTKQG